MRVYLTLLISVGCKLFTAGKVTIVTMAIVCLMLDNPGFALRGGSLKESGNTGQIEIELREPEAKTGGGARQPARLIITVEVLDGQVVIMDLNGRITMRLAQGQRTVFEKGPNGTIRIITTTPKANFTPGNRKSPLETAA